MTRKDVFSFDDWEEHQRKVDYHEQQSIFLNEVEIKPVEWIWPGFIPRGMVTIITGEEGLGKSQLALKLAASYSNGTGHFAEIVNPRTGHPGGLVKLYSAEDPLEEVLLPRMIANGANRLHVAVEGINIQTFLPDGIDDIARGIHELGFSMVIIDPVIAYIGAKADSNSAQDVRYIMRKLADLADVSGCTIIGVMHPKKGEEAQALHKMIGGSAAFGQAARSVLGVTRYVDEDEDKRVIGRIKGNLSRRPKPWIYEISSITLETKDGKAVPTSKIEMLREVDVEDGFDFEAAVQGRPGAKKEKKVEDLKPLNVAITFLQAELIEGPVRSDILRSLAYETGISKNTLYRAKDELGLISFKDPDDPRKVFWQIP